MEDAIRTARNANKLTSAGVGLGLYSFLAIASASHRKNAASTKASKNAVLEIIAGKIVLLKKKSGVATTTEKIRPFTTFSNDLDGIRI
jgi:hypothetical protein